MSEFSQQQEALINGLAQKYQVPDSIVTDVFNANCEFLASRASITSFIPLLALRRSEEQLRTGSLATNLLPTMQL